MKATERVVRFQPPSEGYWLIPSENGDIMLKSSLLPSMTQDKLAGYSTKEGFHAISTPEHFELFDALYELRNAGGDIERARDFVRQSIRDSYPNTSTRIIYTPKGQDRVIHGYGTASVIEKKADLVGPDGDVTKVLTPEASLALTGQSPEKIAELMNYINGTPVYIYRVNSKPRVDDERVARFCADSGGAILSGNRGPQGVDPSLGVKFGALARQKKSKK